jgi:hypothetical protein
MKTFLLALTLLLSSAVASYGQDYPPARLPYTIRWPATPYTIDKHGVIKASYGLKIGYIKKAAKNQYLIENAKHQQIGGAYTQSETLTGGKINMFGYDGHYREKGNVDIDGTVRTIPYNNPFPYSQTGVPTSSKVEGYIVGNTIKNDYGTIGYISGIPSGLGAALLFFFPHTGE